MLQMNHLNYLTLFHIIMRVGKSNVTDGGRQWMFD